MRIIFILVAVTVASLRCASAETVSAGATQSDWPSYGGTTHAWRYSALDRVNRTNVRSLAPAWIFQTGEYNDALQATPIVIDGVMYLSTNQTQVFALNAATGAQLWHSRYNVAAPNVEGFDYVLFGAQNRGVAVAGGKVFVGTHDNFLLALDARTGEELWKVNIDNARQCGCAPRGAPLVVGNKVIIGGTGGDGAHRGYLTAFDTETGRLAWRWYAIPAPGEKGNDTWKGESWRYGGAATWMTGSYDPELKLLYWGTGNAASDFYAGDRVVEPRKVARDVNLYTASVVALDPDSGKLRWHYQVIPNDVWDFDSAYEIILFDKVVDGHERKLLAHMNKSGLTVVLDRVTGKYLHSFLANEINDWISGIAKDGTLLGRRDPVPGVATDICPSGLIGGKSWNQMAYSPRTGYIYAPLVEVCNTIVAQREEPREGMFYAGGSGSVFLPPNRENYAHLDAFDPLTGERKWSWPYRYILFASVLATAGDLIFSGRPDGYFFALDARTGEELWKFQTGAGHRGSSISYAIDGRQYIATPTGWGTVVGPMAAGLFPGEGEKWRRGSTLVVFALPEQPR
ncbi:MAG: PQQ-binding-like beta-propeller repeat protein [Gammaproteobacteria bacterium]|nr:PQQ-binding-like beta-propeller repeat protein [Gammaproteobacteria bacterium]